jgi:hypothetical protein
LAVSARDTGDVGDEAGGTADFHPSYYLVNCPQKLTAFLGCANGDADEVGNARFVEVAH